MPDVFFRDGDDLVALSGAGWATEDELQELLARHPTLLTGGDEEAELRPRRLMLVGREVAIADEPDAGGRWSVDHLFLDQDAVPTVVETKRSSDTRIRREVVGQMLDYAANAGGYWTTESLRARLDARAGQQGTTAAELISELLDAGGPVDEESFWDSVGTNLATGRVRLVFVADRIPNELRRIVEFLSEQMSPCSVSAVEIRRYVGEGREMLVPRVIGATPSAVPAVRRPGRAWDLNSFRQHLRTQDGAESVAIVDEIVEWAERQGLRLPFGNGELDTAIYPTLDIDPLTPGGASSIWLFGVFTYGTVEIPFQWLSRRAYFDDLERRKALRDALQTAIPGLVIADEKLDKRPSFPLRRLSDHSVRRTFLSVMDTALQDFRDHVQGGSTPT